LRLYEGLFLVDHNLARTNYEDVEKHIHGIINRYEGEVVQSLKWAERKLAFPIRFNNIKHEKGAYILIHFNAEPTSVIKMDRQFRLSETVLRHLVTRDEDGLFDEASLHQELFESDEAQAPREDVASPADAPAVASEGEKPEKAPRPE